MDRPDLDSRWAAGLTFGEYRGRPRAASATARPSPSTTVGTRSTRSISHEVDRLARGLIHLGVEPVEKVCLWLNNCPKWMFAMFAVARIGAVHVPINPRFRVSDLQYVLAQSDAATLITHDRSGPSTTWRWRASSWREQRFRECGGS